MMQPRSDTLTDDEFLQEFERGALNGPDFPHRAHLRMAWLYVRRLGTSRAVERAASGIRSLAGKHGQANRYHDTLTRAWVYAIGAAVEARPDLSTFDRFLDCHPELLDKSLLLRHYSAERLSSSQARDGWLSPDLKPIPGAPPTSTEEGGAHRPVAAVPPEEYRRALRQVPRPVAVVTARDATRLHGTTISAVASVSVDPALLVVCLHQDSRLLDIARAAGGFAVSYLGSDQVDVAEHFADPNRPPGTPQFHPIPHFLGPFGAPIISGGPVWFECALSGMFDTAGQQLVCGTVVAQGTGAGSPLQRLHGGWI